MAKLTQETYTADQPKRHLLFQRQANGKLKAAYVNDKTAASLGQNPERIQNYFAAVEQQLSDKQKAEKRFKQMYTSLNCFHCQDRKTVSVEMEMQGRDYTMGYDCICNQTERPNIAELVSVGLYTADCGLWTNNPDYQKYNLCDLQAKGSKCYGVTCPKFDGG